jgi:hypothetical protein
MMKGFIGLFYPHAPQKRRYGDEKYVRWWIRIKLTQFQVTVPHLMDRVFIKKIAFDKPIQISEAGASVYYSSKIAWRVPKLWCNRSWFDFYRETIVRSFGWIG